MPSLLRGKGDLNFEKTQIMGKRDFHQIGGTSI